MVGNSQISATRRRGPGRPFAKGISGNPRGRPKADFDIQALFRQHTDEALKALLKALREPKYRVAAAVAILAYGWGRPVAATEVGQTEDDRSTTFVLKIVPARHQSENGANGANPPRVISIPHQVIDDADN